LRVVGEIDSLEGHLGFVQTLRVHDDDRSFGGTGTSNQQSVKHSRFLSLFRAYFLQGSNLVNDVFGSLRVGSRNEQLRENESLGGSPLGRLPVFPLARVRVNVVVKDSLLVEVLSLSRNGGQVAVYALKNFLVEFHTVFIFHETAHRPGKAESPAFFEEVKIDLLLALLSVLAEHGSEQVEHLEDANNFGGFHHVLEILADEVENGLLGGIIRASLIVETLMFEVLGDQSVDPLALFRVARLRSLRLVNSIGDPSVNEGLPVEISVGHENDTVTRDSSRGGISEILNLESHLGGVTHGDTLRVGESQNLVIIKDSVQILNPNGVDRSITINPIVELV